MIGRMLLALPLVLLIVGTGALPVEEKTVQITDKGYSPDRIEVMVGDKVVWKNVSLRDHSVTARGKPAVPAQEEKDKPLFDSGPIKPGDSFEYTFKKEGTWEYGCTLDKKMSGTIVVKPAK